MEKKKSGVSKGLFWGVTVVLVLLMAGLGYFVYTMKEDITGLEKSLKVLEKQKTVSKTEETPVKTESKCSTLSGRYSLKSENVERFYEFKEDGTYLTGFIPGGGSRGLYKVSGEFIYFFQTGELGASGEIFDYYAMIDEDCKKILMHDNNNDIVLTKEEN